MELKGPSTMKIKKGMSTCLVHINRIRAMLQGEIIEASLISLELTAIITRSITYIVMAAGTGRCGRGELHLKRTSYGDSLVVPCLVV